MVEPHSSNFRVITTNFWGVRIFRKFTVCMCWLLERKKYDDDDLMLSEGLKPFSVNLANSRMTMDKYCRDNLPPLKILSLSGLGYHNDS